jgi:hypothetical protein
MNQDEEAFPSHEDERCKALVCELVARGALAHPGALYDVRHIPNAWDEVKGAYDAIEFRRSHQKEIIAEAKRIARKFGQTPDLMVSTEPPVPCRIEGMGPLYFYNESRALPIWRVFEPGAIATVMQEKGRKTA